MNAHPVHSLKVNVNCSACNRKNRKTQGKLSKAKSVLQDIRDTVARLKKSDRNSDDEDGDDKGVLLEHAATVGIDDEEFERVTL